MTFQDVYSQGRCRGLWRLTLTLHSGIKHYPWVKACAYRHGLEFTRPKTDPHLTRNRAVIWRTVICRHWHHRDIVNAVHGCGGIHLWMWMNTLLSCGRALRLILYKTLLFASNLLDWVHTSQPLNKTKVHKSDTASIHLCVFKGFPIHCNCAHLPQHNADLLQVTAFRRAEKTPLCESWWWD